MATSREITTRAVAYSQFWRAAAGMLVLISRGGRIALVVALLGFETRLGNQLRLLRTFVVLSLAPELAAWLLARAFAALVTIGDGVLVLQRRGQQIEIPCEAIADVVPWTVPLPAGGLWLRLRSGRRFRYGLRVADPIAFADALADAGAPAVLRAIARHPVAVYVRSRALVASRWSHPLLRFVVFALLPTIPLFRLHQWIAYGDTFGEYYLYGLHAYLLGFAAFWWTWTIYLVLYDAVLQGVVEAVVLATAWTAPARVPAVRRVGERLRTVLYFSGVPVFLLRIAALT